MRNGQRIANGQSRVVRVMQEGLGGIRDIQLDGAQEAYSEVYRRADRRRRMAIADNAFIALRRLAQFGLGGRMGDGRQFVSWIHERDFIRAIEFLIGHQSSDGIVNIAAPSPLPNAEMMRLFREHCGVPVGLPAAKWMLELGAFFLRTETELVIKSRRVIPGRLLEAGFTFEFEDFNSAIENLMKEGKPT